MAVKITLLLNENDNDSIPHEYDLELTKKVVENEYVFTEQNLKKYQQRKRELEVILRNAKTSLFKKTRT